MSPLLVGLLLATAPLSWAASRATTASGATTATKAKDFNLPSMEDIGGFALSKMNPQNNGVFDQQLTQDAMDKVVFPFLDKVLPGGTPKLATTVIASDQLKVSKNEELNVKLEGTGIKVLGELAYQHRQQVMDYAIPEITKHVFSTWEGNNNTKEFYAGEQVKLFQLAVHNKGVLFPPFTTKELRTRKLLASFAIFGPLAVWILLQVTSFLHRRRNEQGILPEPVAAEKRFFPHLDGMRTLAAMIIIWFHYSGVLGPYSIVAAQENLVKPRFTPVSFFLVLSGFCMHYAYCKKVYHNIWDVLKYIAVRLGKVVPSYWVAWGIFFFVMHPRYSPFLKKDEGWVDRFNEGALWSFFMLQSWTEWALYYTPEPLTAMQTLTGTRDGSGGDGYAGDFGNLWTVSTLLLPWLMYPLFHILVTGISKASPTIGLRVLTVFVYIAGMVPALMLYAEYGDELRAKSVYTLKVNPVFLVPQFILGMCTAELLKQAEERPETLAGIPKWVNTCLADAAITLTFFLVLAVPFKWFDRGFEVLFIGGEAHLIAAFLYFSCLPGAGKGLWTTFTGNPIMVKLGEYAMHVYLLQYPLAVVMDALMNGLPADSRPPFPGWLGQVELMAGLWTMSILFSELLDKPLQRGLASLLGESKKKPMATA